MTQKFATAYCNLFEGKNVAAVIKARNEHEAMKLAILRETRAADKKEVKQWLDGIKEGQLKEECINSDILIDACPC